MEEVLELEEPLRRLHVLVGGDAADGGLVHADVLAHVPEGERPQEGHALVEELPLELHEALGHLPQRALALLHALDEPDGRAELLLYILLRLVARAAEERAVEGIDAETRDALLVQHHHVVVAELVNGHVGSDIALVRGREAAARLGLETLDLLDGLHDAVQGQLQGAGDVGIAPPLQVLEVLLDDLH